MNLKLKKTIALLILFVLLFPYGTAMAAEITIEEARNAIASYAVNFYKKHGDEVFYYLPGSYFYRNKAYLSKTKYNKNTFVEDKDGDYLLDCVGWTMFCVHYATGLECGVTESNASTSSLNFSSPQTPKGQTEYFEVVKGTPQPGDLISNSGHIMVYVGDTIDGNGMIVHSNGGDSLSYGELSNYSKGYSSIARLKESALSDITSLDTAGNPLSTSTSSKNSAGTNIDMADFYYNGVPDGKYSVTASVLDLIIGSIAGIFKLLVFILISGVRMVFVGWAAIVENLLTYSIKSIIGSDTLETVPITSTEINSNDNITIEKIVFNQIGIFDVNFFNFNGADDDDKDDDIVSKDGTLKDGTSKGGTSKDGTSKDGTSKGGTSKDGTSKGGTSKDGTSKDGSSKDGTSKDGTSKDGTSKDGTSVIIKSKDGPIEVKTSKDEIVEDKVTLDAEDGF